MKSSIRKFLIINLLLTITLTTILTSIGNHYLDKLGQHIAMDDLYIILLIFPLSGILIWIIIGRGLKSINKVTLEVSNRAPLHLEPVNIKELPSEITPLIDELNKLFFRLKEGFEREKRFAEDAAHELRTPLAAIQAQAQVALHASDLVEKNKALEKLLVSVNRSTHVVQQLLTMSKLASESVDSITLHKVNLTTVTRETLALLAPSALEKKIELEFDHDEKVVFLLAHATAISILIRNLVDNAIRYCADGGHVIVRVYRFQHEIIVEVQDNGPGIPEKLQSRVFERFFRMLGNTSHGSGLGLSIVQQIASLYRGRVLLETPKNGSGLIVKVFFPSS